MCYQKVTQCKLKVQFIINGWNTHFITQIRSAHFITKLELH